MSGSVRHLDAVVPPGEWSPEAAVEDHPMRRVTRDVAFDGAAWTPERRAKVAALFDGLAGEWHTRDRPGRHDALHDALERGEVAGGRCLEVGSGTGMATPMLAARFDGVVALDLSGAMLALAPPDAAPRVLADSSVLPFPDGAFDAVALVNALLFPAETARVLTAGGVVIWVNTSGDKTPIHLPAEDVAAALPGEWDGLASQAGTGTWAVLRRRPRA